jgi:hypothetical protein
VFYCRGYFVAAQAGFWPRRPAGPRVAYERVAGFLWARGARGARARRVRGVGTYTLAGGAGSSRMPAGWLVERAP